MTEQHQQTNINQPMSGARRVNQDDIDTTLPVPGIPLNADDEFVYAIDDGVRGSYTIFLPDVREVEGKDITIKADAAASLASVNVSALQTTTPAQTIDGAATIVLPLNPLETLVVRADPPDTTVTPTVAPTNWSIVRIGAP